MCSVETDTLIVEVESLVNSHPPTHVSTQSLPLSLAALRGNAGSNPGPYGHEFQVAMEF